MNLTKIEKNTFSLHLLYSILEGIIAGVLVMNEFVFIKSLHGSNILLGVLFQFSIIVFIFSVLFNEIIKRTVNKGKLLRITVFITRLPLFLLLFFPTSENFYTENLFYHYIFIFIFLIYFLSNNIIFPIINQLLKNNYSHDNFGKLYSYSTTVNKIVMLVATFFFGMLLDFDNYAFTYIYPTIAVISIISTSILSMIKDSVKPISTVSIENGKDENSSRDWSFKVVISSIKESVKSMFGIVKNNKPYRDFEIGFMFYGFAFMISFTVVTIFFEKVLNLNYTSVAFYKNSYNILAILLLPFMGKLIGKMDPRKFAAITFGSLLLYLLFVMLTEYFPSYFEYYDIKFYYLLLVSFAFHGVFAATMSLLWSIGSAYFCEKEEVSTYQSVHLTLTGVRGSFAPLLGIIFYELLGFTMTFSLAMFSLLIAIVVMLLSIRRRRSLKDEELDELVDKKGKVLGRFE